MSGKIQIIKVNVPPRQLTARWTLEPEKPPFPLKGVKDMTEEEQADEIIRRLSTPYRSPAEMLEDELSEIMAAEITKEIDNEILKSLTGYYGKTGTRT